MTRAGALTEKEQAKINAANAKSARMTQMKSRMSNLHLKLVCMIQKLKVNLTEHKNTKDEVEAETERGALVLLIQANWPKTEVIGAELNDASIELSDAEGIEINRDPGAMIANFKNKAMKAHQEYVTLKEKHNKEVRDLNKLQIRTGNMGDEVTEIRK